MLQTKQELQKDVKRFYRIQKDYYNARLDDKELADKVTQPVWESMYLIKRRLKQKGLRMDATIWELPKERRNTCLYQERILQDGGYTVGECIQDVVIHKNFWRGDKKIYSKREKENCAIHTLKANVQDEEAVCPNLGDIGKISGFFLEENITEKVKKILKDAVRLCIIPEVILLILTILSIIGLTMVMWVINSGNDKGLLTKCLALFSSINMDSAMWSTFIELMLVYGIVGTALIFLFPKRITGESIVKEVIPEFSAQDFLHNLEYKIRDIHFVNSDSEVSVFAACDMKDIVKQYEDVVDCSMRKLRFTDIKQDGLKYYLGVTAHLKLSMYRGHRIRNKQERVMLTISGKKEVFLNDSLAIREHKCPDCNSNVTLFEGGKCNFCETKLDYRNHSWLIDGYDSKLQMISDYVWIKLGFVGIFMAILFYNLRTNNLADNEAWYLYEEVRSVVEVKSVAGVRNVDKVKTVEEILNEYFEDIEMPDELGLDVQLENMEKEIRFRSYQYLTENGMDVAMVYREKLEELGYIYEEKYFDDKRYDIYKPIEHGEDQAFFKLSVQYDEESIFIDIMIVPFLGE